MNLNRRQPGGRALLTFALLVSSATLMLQEAAAHDLPAAEEVSLVEVTVPDHATVERLQPLYGLTEWTRDNPDGTVTINVEATPAELAELAALGYVVGATIEDHDTWHQRLAERAQAIAAENRSLALAAGARSTSARGSRSRALDTVTMARADYFKNYAGAFLSVEAKSSSGSGTTLSASYDTGSGFGAATTMSAFVDDGVYLYHRVLIRVGPSTYAGPAPITARVGSSAGGVGTLPAKAWPGPGLPPFAGEYLQGFFTHYMDPTEVYARIDSLAAEFSNIAEIVDLPYDTNGYQRKAMCVMAGTTACNGTPADASSAIYLEAKAYGQEGGNAVQAEFVNVLPPPLAPIVSVSGTRITVQLGVASSAAQVRDAINGDAAASALVTAHTYAGNAGLGVVMPRALVNLSDFLSAPPSVQRGPFQLRVLRIGKVRDGSKIGVFLFCQQHAREWVTPLTCVETAERLLRNYATDPGTRELVDNLDIFILPSYNPDGSHYSMYDFASQRKNMTRHCALTTTSGMPASRNAWGVDNNRNNSVGSIFDGYTGASSSCTSEVYAGPSEVSEPENKNETWLVDTFSNIRFSNNIHTYGGYFMWAPGAYILSGRQTLPHANIGVEGYFFDAARTVLGRIHQYRSTAVLPARTGPIADVLYSAAGNSADDQYYRKGIIGYSFEAGSDRFTSTTSGTSQSAVGFMPAYATEGAPEAMEFAWGNYGLFEEALKYANDTTPPDSAMLPNGAASTTSIVSTFQWASEAAVIHYTLDGSTPTLESPTWNAQSPSTGRMPGELFVFTAPRTTVNWIAQDIRGNVSDVKSATFYVDTVAPTTTASLAPPAVNGWYSKPTVTLAGDDGPDGSGVASTEYSLDGGPFTTYGSPFALNGDGEHTIEFRSTDAVGNVEATQSSTFDVDSTAPAVLIASPENDRTYLKGSAVTASYSCSDATSGVAACTGTVADGQQVDTDSVGPQTFAVTGRDVAGNESTQTITYTISFAFSGFFQPVDNPPTLNIAKGGTGIPVRFALGGNQGLAIFAAGYPQQQAIACDTQAPTDKIEETTRASGLSYDATTGRYTYAWKTGRSWAGSCRRLTLRLTDGSVHTALFKVTK